MGTKHDKFHVFLNTERIGTVAHDDGKMSFEYAPEYLWKPDAYPLSRNLPLTGEEFHNLKVKNFFSNLLPDKQISMTVAMALHVSVNNTLGATLSEYRNFTPGFSRKLFSFAVKRFASDVQFRYERIQAQNSVHKNRETK